MSRSQANGVRRATSNVVSILCVPYSLPHYRDKRGPNTSFQAELKTGQVVEITGTRTVFGLVIHRQLRASHTSFSFKQWGLSEPSSGCLVASGITRQDCLDDLALKVAYIGGEDAFLQAIRSAAARVIQERK